jgi:hypothetical protein
VNGWLGLIVCREYAVGNGHSFGLLWSTLPNMFLVVIPGFPFGPIRPNTRAGFPLTVRVSGVRYQYYKGASVMGLRTRIKL